MMRDFNEVLLSNEKVGSHLVNTRIALRFQECLDACDMMDMGFSGAKYTWSNMRGVAELIQERLGASVIPVG